MSSCATHTYFPLRSRTTLTAPFRFRSNTPTSSSFCFPFSTTVRPAGYAIVPALISPFVSRLDLRLGQPQFGDTTEQKIRNLQLEMLNRLPANDLLRPFVSNLLKLAMYLLEVENEVSIGRCTKPAYVDLLCSGECDRVSAHCDRLAQGTPLLIDVSSVVRR
jgi:hypothetical protein